MWWLQKGYSIAAALIHLSSSPPIPPHPFSSLTLLPSCLCLIPPGGSHRTLEVSLLQRVCWPRNKVCSADKQLPFQNKMALPSSEDWTASGMNILPCCVPNSSAKEKLTIFRQKDPSYSLWSHAYAPFHARKGLNSRHLASTTSLFSGSPKKWGFRQNRQMRSTLRNWQIQSWTFSKQTSRMHGWAGGCGQEVWARAHEQKGRYTMAIVPTNVLWVGGRERVRSRDTQAKPKW